MREYFSSEETSQVGKGSGFVGWATAGAALLLGGYAGYRAARGSLTSGLHAWASRVGPKSLSEMSSPSRRAFNGSPESILRGLYSEEANVMVGALDGVVESAVSFATKSARTTAFTESLLKEVPGPADQKKLLSVVDRLISRSHKMLEAGSVDTALSMVNDPKFVSDASKILSEAGIKPSSFSSVEDVFSTALKKAHQSKPTRNMVEKAFQGVEGVKSADTVYDAISGLADRSKHSLLDTLLPAEESSQLKFGQMFQVSNDGKLTMTSLGKEVEDFFEVNGGIKGVVSTIGQKFEHNLSSAFGAVNSKGGFSLDLRTISKGSVEDKFLKRFMDTTTGIIKEDRAFVSRQQVANKISTTAENLYNELNLPLLPGAFNIKLAQLGSFLKSDKQVIRDVGSLSSQPEVQRLLNKTKDELKGFYGLGVGDQLLTYDSTKGTFEAVTDASFNFSSTIRSRHTRDTLRIRNANRATYQTTADSLKETKKSAFGSLVEYLGGGEHDQSSIEKFIFNNQHHFTDVSVESGKIVMMPKKTVTGPALAAIKKITPNPTDVSPHFLNPANLQKAFEASSDHAGLRTKIVRSALDLADKQRTNIGGYLETAAKEVSALIENNPEIAKYLGPHAPELIGAASDPVKFIETASNAGIFSDEMATQLKNFGSLNRFIQSAQEDFDGLVSIDSEVGGLLKTMQESVFGERTLSFLGRQMQDAMLEESLIARGASQLFEAGLDSSTAQVIASAHYTEIDLSNPLAAEVAKMFGGADSDSIKRGVQRVVSGLTTNVDPDTQTTFNISKLRELAKSVANIERKMEDPAVFVKGKKIQSDSIFGIGLDIRQKTTPILGEGIFQSVNERTANIIDNNFFENLVDQYKFGKKSFSPFQTALDDTFDANYYATIKSPGMASKVGMFESSLKALYDPEAPMTTFSYGLQTMLGMPNSIAQSFGMGLKDEDRVTALRTLAAFGLKRVLPIFTAYEAYKNINSDAERLGLPGIDDVAANTLARLQIGHAELNDALGLTGVTKRFMDRIPGLDVYGTVRSADEVREYLAYGDEEVRKSRFWLIGSRTPFGGMGVESYIPNYYRRWKSNWTYQAGIADPDYSFLPTLSNPLAPLSRVLTPDWFLDSQGSDRPYRQQDAFGGDYGEGGYGEGGGGGGTLPE